jgi:pantoate--beta-alanine ligase
VSPPEVIAAPETLRERLDGWRREKLRIGLVPTMGNLHSGHLDLVRATAERADKVVVSIFVNPLQFGPNEDFASYPRTPAEDLAALGGTGCALAFMPGEAAMYPRGRHDTTRVEVPGLSEILCGKSRPGHFSGVATAVAKLFNLVQPQLATFGEKDFQQLAVIRQMTAELCFAVEILSVATRREADGLAMSSRNRYLDHDQRARAPRLHTALQDCAGALRTGRRDFVALQQEGMDNIRSAGMIPEYFEVRRQEGLGLPEPADKRLVILAAVWLGRTRLIDNLAVEL